MPDGRCQVGLARTRTADENDVLCVIEELAAVQGFDLAFGHRALGEVEAR